MKQQIKIFENVSAPFAEVQFQEWTKNNNVQVHNVNITMVAQRIYTLVALYTEIPNSQS